MEGLILKLIVLCLTVLMFEANATEHSRSKRAPVDWLFSPVLNETGIQLILEGHNSRRRSVVPAASNMNELYWDEDLAGQAKGHSKKCVPDHVNNPAIGENFHISTAKDFDAVLTTFVDNWFKESENFDYETNTCDEGAICGHYKQMVWADSNAIGCGVSRCSKVDTITEEEVFIVICNYTPRGNVVLQLDELNVPLEPYKAGEACSECQDGTVCNNGLCSRPVATATTPTRTVPSIFNLAQDTTAKSDDMCYQQNKKIIDKWEDSLGEWREDVDRWRQNMDKYEAYLKKELE